MSILFFSGNTKQDKTDVRPFRQDFVCSDDTENILNPISNHVANKRNPNIVKNHLKQKVTKRTLLIVADPDHFDQICIQLFML